jgi:hypothetical protein
VDYRDYLGRFLEHRAVAQVDEFGAVEENGRPYPLLRAQLPGRHLLVVTAGFHGEEPAGPLTLLAHLPQLWEWARAHDVGFLVYPCVNPSGFEAGTRYNASGERPNNDFLRYEVSPGVIQGELEAGQPFVRHFLFDGGPKETRLLRAELERQPTPVAALDLHQDRYLQGSWTYAYTFGPKAAYAPLVAQAAQVAQVARNLRVDEQNTTDELGLIEYNDGSVTDYYLRRGARFAATLETTTHSPPEVCDQVNLIWLRGFIELAARGVTQPGAWSR